MSRKVLVVDDEKLIVKGLRFSLEQDGMEVDCAYDGEEALEKAKAGEYDIILLDLMLPKMDGLEVCQQIREFSNVPIIMLTAKGEDMDKILGLEYGADDYVTKPFNILEVKARIKAIIRRAGSNQNKQEKAKTVEVGELKLDCEGRRVFISGKDGYDRKLFSINCLDFLSKPICYSDLERTVNRFRKLTRRPEDVFTFQNNHVLQRAPIANILYFESTNRKVNIITTTDMLEFYDKLDNVESQVPTQFFRIHKSFLVNYYHIRKFEYDNVIMSNQKRLPISQSKRKEMRDLQLEIEDMEE